MPVDLGVASVDDMAVRDNIDVFEKNGFGFVEDVQSGMLKLASVPFSKGTTFGPDDVHEMVCSSLSEFCRFAVFDVSAPPRTSAPGARDPMLPQFAHHPRAVYVALGSTAELCG